MKRLFATIVMVLGFAVAAGAMSYSQAREQALFLTDKMAYELNLTDDQYEAAYEINLDYLLSVNSDDELYGDYWRWRNIDFSYVLLDWQYRMFCEAAYFYRPLYFSAGVWHFAIYARYPHRDYFYFHRPTVYVSYRGGHSWRQNNGSSWYSGRTFGSRRGGDAHFGMRDGFKRGDYGRGNRQSFGSRGSRQVESRGNSGFGSRRDNSGSGFGSRSSSGFGSSRSSSGFGSSRGSGFGSRESSTRTTVRQPESNRGFSGSSFGSRRDNSSGSSAPRSTFKPSGSSRSGGFGSRR
ncbi:hypothetical protein DW060_01320 [Leyella stercorea]|uniref:DUF3300 domain-containing protein n=1 Tax=Leyella stercorea TaxID=363265 RepID=A0A3R6G6J0_9BACT|nr:hypothetical protein DW060_01320 [Leyella stercorea]